MIRYIQPQDLDYLVQAGERFFKVSEQPEGIVYSPAALRAFLTEAITNENMCVFIDDEYKGAIGGVATPYYMTGQIIVSELFWWVEPEYRGSLGGDLLHTLEEWAKYKEADAVSMVSLESSNPRVMDRVYRRKGFKLMEHSYLKAV